MNNALIFGFGRSGTSLMGGMLHNSGYFLGEHLYPPRESNPKGFFENERINSINEKILEQFDYCKLFPEKSVNQSAESPYNPSYGQRWLSFIDTDKVIANQSRIIEEEIRNVTAEPKFAYKDPRFSYTLPVWRPFLSDKTVLICMFRQPDVVVESVLKDCQTADYLQKFNIDHDITFRLWENCYRRILNSQMQDSELPIVFIHFEQLLSLKAIPKLNKLLDIQLITDFVSPELNRSKPLRKTPDQAKKMYETLCRLADF